MQMPEGGDCAGGENGERGRQRETERLRQAHDGQENVAVTRNDGEQVAHFVVEGNCLSITTQGSAIAVDLRDRMPESGNFRREFGSRESPLYQSSQPSRRSSFQRRSAGGEYALYLRAHWA